MLSKTKIEYGDRIWNPIVGCDNNCDYCWARKMNKRFKWIKNWNEPEFFLSREREPLDYKKSSKVLTVFTGDLFSPSIDPRWVHRVLGVIAVSPHIHIVLTKFPEHAIKYGLSLPNLWFGVTIESNQFLARMDVLSLTNARVKFVSFEPLLDDISIANNLSSYAAAIENLDWIIVGAQTDPCKPPKRRWVYDIINISQVYGIPVFLKDNLIPLLGEKFVKFIQDYPE